LKKQNVKIQENALGGLTKLIAILCPPDEAAREAVSLVENPDVKLLDASSASHIEWLGLRLLN